MSQLLAELREWALINNVAAFLRVIRAGESGQDDSAFRLLYGGSMFDSFNDHPRKRFPIVYQGKQDYTTAAGAFQIVESTWNDFTGLVGKVPFTPENQTLCAIWRLKYRKALDHVIAGRLREAIRALPLEWTSLALPQRQAQAQAIFEKYGGTLASDSPPATHPPEVRPTMPAPILLSLLPSLVELLPKLGAIFGSGSEVANRNIAAATVVADAVKAATNSPNLQAAIEEMQRNPEAVAAANAAIDTIWPSITEAGGGGIEGARKAALAPDAPPFWKQAPFAITVLLIPLVYLIVLASLGKFEWLGDITSETRAQVIGTVLGSIIGGIVGYFYGTSSGSQRKTDLLAK